MKKNFSFRGLLLSSLVVLAAMLSSCSKSAYKKAIPADAPIVVELDVKNIGLKSDFLAQKDDIADLILSIDPEDADLKKLADMLRNPQDMGLDMLSPLYFFTPSSMEEGYILASVRDKETVAKKLATISEAVELSESGEITWVEEHGRLVAALTQKSLLLGSSNNRNDYRDLLENDKSFFSTDAGKFFKKNAADITSTINMENLSRKAKREIRSEVEHQFRDLCPYLTEEVWEKLFEMQCVANLDFKSGEFDINFFVNGYDDDDDNLLIKKVSKETLKLIPERNLIALVALGIDGEEYCKAIEKAMEETGASFSGEEKMIYNMVKQILRKTDGTLAAAVAGKNFDSDPDFLFIMPTPFSEIKPMLDIFGDEIPKDVYVDGDKKAFSVTNIRTYTYGDAKPSFEKAGNATSSYVYAYVDAEPIVDAYFTERTRRTIPEEARFLNTWRRLADLFDFAQLKVEKRDEATIEFVLNEDSKNSLALFLEQGIKIGVACVEYDKVRAQRYNYDYLLDEDYYDVEVVEAEESAPAEQGEEVAW